MPQRIGSGHIRTADGQQRGLIERYLWKPRARRTHVNTAVHVEAFGQPDGIRGRREDASIGCRVVLHRRRLADAVGGTKLSLRDHEETIDDLNPPHQRSGSGALRPHGDVDQAEAVGLCNLANPKVIDRQGIGVRGGRKTKTIQHHVVVEVEVGNGLRSGVAKRPSIRAAAAGQYDFARATVRAPECIRKLLGEAHVASSASEGEPRVDFG